MKQKLTKLLCSVFLVAFAIPAIAQSSGGSSTRTITGKVTDSEGAPIISAKPRRPIPKAGTRWPYKVPTQFSDSPAWATGPVRKTQRAAPSSTSRWRPTTNCSKMSWW